MVILSKIYITNDALRDLGTRNIPNVDMNYCSLTNNSMVGAFYENPNVVSVTNINSDVNNMQTYQGRWGGGVFGNCYNLTDAPDMSSLYSVTQLSFTFWNCFNLVNINSLPPYLTSLERTFFNCYNLVNVPEIPNSVTYMFETFGSCSSLVNTPVIPNSVTSLARTFWNCSNLVNATAIPNSVTNMYGTFSECSNLVNAPDLSNCTNLTNMNQTFFGCYNLVNAPVIPNSVDNVECTFQECHNLVNAPVIPNSVTNMYETFEGCSNLVNAPVIPNSVTNIYRTFRYCYNLAGVITIESENVHDAYMCFEGTSLEKNVLIPFNISQSETYVKGYYWITNDGTVIYAQSDLYSRVQENPYKWEYEYNLKDENFNNLNSDCYIRWNPDEQQYETQLLDDGDWIYGTATYDSNNNVIINKSAGDTSFTYDSFINAGYDTVNRVNGVLLKDINDRGTLEFVVTPSQLQGTSIYVDDNLINSDNIEIASGSHTYKLINSNYTSYYGNTTVSKNNTTTITKDLTNITGYNITVNTNVSDCEVRFNGELGTTVTSTQYTSPTMYSEDEMTIGVYVGKYGYTTYYNEVTFDNNNIVLNVTLVDIDVDLTDWEYTIDENNVVRIIDYKGADVETLVMPKEKV